MSDIFISYSKEDRSRAKDVAARLKQEGWDVFWDRTIPIGKTWDEVLERELYDTKVIIVLWSNNSVKSEWVRAEAANAISRRILVPAALESVTFPIRFQLLQTADISDWKLNESDTEGMQLLVEAVKSIGNLESQWEEETMILHGEVDSVFKLSDVDIKEKAKLKRKQKEDQISKEREELKRKQEKKHFTKEQELLKSQNIPKSKNIPDSIRKASKYIYISLGFEFILITINYLIIWDKNKDISPDGFRIVQYLLNLIGIWIIAFIGYKIQHGKKWARTAFIIFVILNLFPYYYQTFGVYSSLMYGINWFVIIFFQVGLKVYVLYLLYNRESKDWYESINKMNL